MLRASVLIVAAVLAVHLYILARTGNFYPCAAAYAKLEFDAIGTFKGGRRELVPEDPERANLYDAVEKRHILKCYAIALF